MYLTKNIVNISIHAAISNKSIFYIKFYNNNKSSLQQIIFLNINREESLSKIFKAKESLRLTKKFYIFVTVLKYSVEFYKYDAYYQLPLGVLNKSRVKFWKCYFKSGIFLETEFLLYSDFKNTFFIKKYYTLMIIGPF